MSDAQIWERLSSNAARRAGVHAVLLEEQPSRAASDAVYLIGLRIPQFGGGSDDMV